MFEQLTYDLLHEVMRYGVPYKWIIRPDIKQESLLSHVICKHNRAFDYIMEHNDTVLNLDELSSHTSERSIAYLISHPHVIDWKRFSYNPHPMAISYSLQHLDYVDWYFFCSIETDDAVRCIIDHPEQINWYTFSSNKNDLAVDYMIQHAHNIIPSPFSSNSHPKAVTFYITTFLLSSIESQRQFFTNHSDMAVSYLIHRVSEWTPTHWAMFSTNTNQHALSFLMNHPERIRWDWFSSEHKSDEAIAFIIKNHDKVNWNILSSCSNDVIVDFLLDHPHNIYVPTFIMNTNEKAINYILTQKVLSASEYRLLSYNPSIFIPTEDSEKIEFYLTAFSQNPYQKCDDNRMYDVTINILSK